MTFLEKISQLRLKAVAADDEDRIKSRSGEFTALRERLQSAAANAASVDVGRKELHAAGETQDGYNQDRAFALAVIQELESLVETVSVEAKFDAVKMQGSLIESHFKRSEKWVADSWRSYVPKATPALNDELLDALEQGGIDVEAIRSDIENAAVTLLTLRNRSLPEPGDNAKLQRALDTLNSSGERIGELVDPAIADVIVRAQGGGVPYLDLTPEVILALQKLGILERFRVVLK